MKFFYPFLILILLTYAAYSQLPEFQWAVQCGNPPNTTDTKTVLTSAHDGYFFLAGEFLDTVRFGNKVMVSSGGTDIFLVKQTSAGELVWSVKLGASDYDYVQRIITDNDGNVIISGFFYGSTQIGTDQYTSYGSQDIFIAKYSPDGNFLWSYRAGGQMADYVAGLAADKNNNIVLTGYFYDAISFGDTTLTSGASSDLYLAAFTPDGDPGWVLSAGGTSSDQVHSVDCDADGNIIIVGSFYNNITFGDTTIATTNPVGVFMTEYSSGGQLERVSQLDGTYLTTNVNVVFCPTGDFYISGDFSEQLFFGNQIFDAGEFNQDIYIAKYDPEFNLVWARHAFSKASDQAVGMAVDSCNNLYFTGMYLDTIHFDGLTLPYTLCCGSREVFVVNYSSDGNVIWGEQITGARANVQSICRSAGGDFLLSGLFSEDLALGPLTLSYYEGFRNYVTCLRSEIYTTVNNYEKNSGWKIYPNPVSDELWIHPPQGIDKFEFAIFSIKGTCELQGEVSGEQRIQVQVLPAGQFILRITDPKGNIIFSVPFIKQ